jgi:hypothetical protein
MRLELWPHSFDVMRPLFAEFVQVRVSDWARLSEAEQHSIRFRCVPLQVRPVPELVAAQVAIRQAILDLGRAGFDCWADHLYRDCLKTNGGWWEVRSGLQDIIAACHPRALGDNFKMPVDRRSLSYICEAALFPLDDFPPEERWRCSVTRF